MNEALFFMIGLGGLCGLMLSLASKIFYVWEDPRIAEIEGCLASANCGACGYTGCSAAASAVVEGAADPSVCIIGGPDVAADVATVMGMDPGRAELRLSENLCNGGLRAEDRFEYIGISSCRALAAAYGGKRVCSVGCLGQGDCVASCRFDAIDIGPNGYPVVNEEKCVGCGACETACPKSILKVRTMSEKLLHTNLHEDALAPCQQTCPAEINIPKYISQIKEGNYSGAVQTIRERNPLLLTCGRVCPHPCEDYCRRGIEDDAVSINQLKRFVADYEMNSGQRLPIPCAPDTEKRVAIIGGGPAGISCAYFLRRLGHSTTIFESMPKLGGMLRYGIPEYRLPKEVLDWEIDGILNLGIDVHEKALGRDFELQDLVDEGYGAVFMGIGAWKDYALGVEGEELSGSHNGIDFLSNVGLGHPVSIGRRAAVIGGGNSAIDCVRTLVRLGADKVYIIYRRTRAEMPANLVEIEAAEHEGVEFIFLAAPMRLIGDSDGKLTHLEYQKMKLGEPDASGRRRPVPIEGSEEQIELDMLITAIGQGPDVSFTEKGGLYDDLKITRWNTIDSVDPETLQTSIPFIFTGGDSATGASLVVEAIGGARRAARSIHQYLSDEPVIPPERSLFRQHIDGTIFESVDGVGKLPRTPMPEMPVAERITSMVEADLVISEKDALYESSRCLNCCRICYDRDAA